MEKVAEIEGVTPIQGRRYTQLMETVSASRRDLHERLRGVMQSEATSVRVFTVVSTSELVTGPIKLLTGATVQEAREWVHEHRKYVNKAQVPPKTANQFYEIMWDTTKDSSVARILIEAQKESLIAEWTQQAPANGGQAPAHDDREACLRMLTKFKKMCDTEFVFSEETAKARVEEFSPIDPTTGRMYTHPTEACNEMNRLLGFCINKKNGEPTVKTMKAIKILSTAMNMIAPGFKNPDFNNYIPGLGQYVFDIMNKYDYPEDQQTLTRYEAICKKEFETRKKLMRGYPEVAREKQRNAPYRRNSFSNATGTRVFATLSNSAWVPKRFYW
jgi:hypothetical protein